MAVQAVRDPFIQKIGGLSVKGFTIGDRCLVYQPMPLDKFWIVMTACTDFGDIFWVSDLMQAGGHMIVKPENELVFLMTHATASHGGIGYSGTNLFEERQRSVKGVVMTVFARRHVLGKLFDIALHVRGGMHALLQKFGHIPVRELGFTGGFDDVALGQTVHLFDRIVGNLLNVRVTVGALYLGMHTVLERVLIDIKESKPAIRVDSAEARVFVTQQAVTDIGRHGGRRCVICCHQP